MHLAVYYIVCAYIYVRAYVYIYVYSPKTLTSGTSDNLLTVY
jgi:hypothetical protein